jgi:hypothetical protein
VFDDVSSLARLCFLPRPLLLSPNIGSDWRVSVLARLIASSLVPRNSSRTPADAGGRRFFMSDNYIIEIHPKFTHATVQAGIVVRDGRGFRFFAAAHAFHALEGQLFKSPKAAEHAALQRADDIKFGSSPVALLGAA